MMMTLTHYIFNTMIDITAISTANLGFSTAPSATKLNPGDCDDDRRSEVAMWPSKPEYLYLWNYDRQDDNSNGKSGVFDHSQCDETDPQRLQQRQTTGNCNMDVLLSNLAISGSRSLSQSFG